jgi:AcrR family transcriptional regulator
MAATDTKDTILDAAETLFAEQGFAATSLRQLTTRAKVNLAAVNYHFGSKDDLAKEVLRRRIEPINSERRQRLDALETPATVADIVRAFIEPALRPLQTEPGTSPQSRAAGLCRVLGRLSVEHPPFLRSFFGEQFGDLGRRFVSALQAAAPEISATTLWWRMHFTVGAMAHTLQSAHLVGQLSEGKCDPDDHDSILQQLIHFAMGGMESSEVGQ